MQVFQTAGDPPSFGRIIFASIGSTKNIRNAPSNIAAEKMMTATLPARASAVRGKAGEMDSV